MGCVGSQQHAYETAPAATWAKSKTGRDDALFHGVVDHDKVRNTNAGDDCTQSKRRVAPSHRSRYGDCASRATDCMPSERVRTQRRPRRIPTNTSVASATSVASGFAEVAEDVLFLRGQLANCAEAERQKILEAALQDNSLRMWHLGKNSMGDRGAFVVSQALIESDRLDLVGLGHNQISDVGAEFLADAISKSKAPLRVTSFADNQFGDEGAAAIGDALQFCPTLEVLDLRSNGIGPRGAVRLAEALQRPGSAVKKLQLGGNQVGDEGAMALAQAWKNCPRLEELALEDNGISDAAAAGLAEALRDGASLLLLGNSLTAEGKRVVRGRKSAITRSGARCTVTM